MIHRLWKILPICILLWTVPGFTVGQEELVVEDGPLIDQQPFDLIHLTNEAGGQTFKVMPIEFPNRMLPSNPKPSDSMEVVFVKFPDRRYSIQWKWISKIELYEDMVLREAKQKLVEKDFIGAFQNLSFLMRNYPDAPQLEQLRLDFLYSSLSASFSARQLEQTLSTLEELKLTAPNYRQDVVTRGMDNVVRGLLERYERQNDFNSIKKMLDRLKTAYGELEVVAQWEARLQELAESKWTEAERFIQSKRYREAFDSVYASLELSPDSRRSRQLLAELSRIHPMVRVGVMQRATELDPSSLTNWASRRSGLLVYQPLLRFLKTGNEGGDYEFALGKHRLSDDRQSLALTIDPRKAGETHLLKVSQLIVERADPQSSGYDPVWAAIFDSVRLKSSNQLDVRLQRPHVLPHALMQWFVPDEADQPTWLPGPYQMTHVDAHETIYALRPGWEQLGFPVEVIEILYEDSKQAISDLARGYIDAIDQLYPADATRLAAESRFQTMTYALPTTHLLIPNQASKHVYLKQEKFRRALLYATDREGILQTELLGSVDARDGRIISGPFPRGLNETDPLAYAYNGNVPSVAYDPQLAKILVTITKQETEKTALKNGLQPPVLDKLMVGCPDFEFARVAVQALLQQWAVIGIEAEMLVLPADNPSDAIAQCDLIYWTVTLWEPATDIHRLLGGNGVSRSDDPFVVQGLERLREARNWREVRTALHDLHQIIAYHLPILPLWQVTDRFAARSSIQGISDRSVSLYQNLNKWRE